MTSPDESVLVSDGKNLWFYNPFVEQVTVTNLADATQDTPFLLITRNNPRDWKQYSIIQQGNTFDLKPKLSNGTLKRFSITVSPEGTIEKFSAVEQDGQTSAYQLKEQKMVMSISVSLHSLCRKGSHWMTNAQVVNKRK